MFFCEQTILIMNLFTWRNILTVCALLLSVGSFFSVFFVDFNIYQVCNEEQKWLFLQMLPFISFCILLWSILSKQMMYSFTKIDCVVLLFVGYVLFRYFTSDGSYVPILVWGGIACLYLCYRILFTNYPRIIPWSVFVLLLTGIVEAIWGHLQLHGVVRAYHPLFRLTGSFFNPGPYSNYLAILLPIAIYQIVSYKKNENHESVKEQRFSFGLKELTVGVSWIYAVCALTILPAARARIAWIAVIVTIILILLEKTTLGAKINLFRKSKSLSFWSVLVSVMLVVAGLTWGMYQYKENSVHGRLLIWKVGIQAVCERPILGAGAGLYAGAYGEAQEAYFSTGQADPQEIYVASPPEYAFNDPLQIAVEYGVVGLLLFLAIVVLAIWRLLPQKNGLAYGAISLFILMQASYPLNLIPFCILLAFFVAASNRSEIQKYSLGRIKTIFLMACVFTGSIYLAYRYDKRYEAMLNWQVFRPSYQNQAYRYILHRYEALYNQLYDIPDFLFEYGNTLRATRNYNQSNYIFRQGLYYKGSALYCNMLGNNAKDQGAYDVAETYYEKSIDRIPNRITPLFLLVNLYVESGQFDKAREAVLRLRAFKPKIESQTVQNMRNEVERLVDVYHLYVPD